MAILRRAIALWWWISVPYSLLIFSLLTFSESKGGYLIHDLPFFGLLFWALLRSSIAWTAVTAILLIRGLVPRSPGDFTKFGLGIVVCIVAVLNIAVR
jgi:hypothetical protein